jgi:hypothetical protein
MVGRSWVTSAAVVLIGLSAVTAAGGRHGRWALFVQRYGWRAYALPILSVVTVVALVQSTDTTASAREITRADAGHIVTRGGRLRRVPLVRPRPRRDPVGSKWRG